MQIQRCSSRSGCFLMNMSKGIWPWEMQRLYWDNNPWTRVGLVALTMLHHSHGYYRLCTEEVVSESWSFETDLSSSLLYTRDCLCDYILLCIFHTEDYKLMFKHVLLCCMRIRFIPDVVSMRYIRFIPNLLCKILMPQSGLWFSKSRFYCMVFTFYDLV